MTKTASSTSKPRRPRTTRPPRPPTPPKLAEALGADVGAALYDYLQTATKKDGSPAFPALEADLADLAPPKHISPVPNRATRREYGVYFDLTEVDRLIRFSRSLRHVKGPLAKKPLELDLWQIVYVAAPVMGWRRADGSRLYRTLFLEVPRKNGKTTLSAALALYCLTADREQGAEVYAAAAARLQARLCFDPAKTMAAAAPALNKRIRPLLNVLEYAATNSFFRVLAGEQAAGLQHGLNVHCAVIDELHVHKNRDLLDVLETGTGSRTNPLIIIITTAGVDDPASIYTEKRDYAEKVADGTLDDPEFLGVIYSIEYSNAEGDGEDDDDVKKNDDPMAESSWRKANPGYGRSLQPSYMAKKAREAANNPAALNTFLRLHLNVRTGQVTRWVPITKWDKCGARWLTPDYARLRGMPAYAGLDLSSSTDLCALALIVPEWVINPEDNEEEIEVLNVILRAWTPADTLANRAKRDRAPYEKWVKQGHLLTTPGEVVDYDVIEEAAFDLAGDFEILNLNFDAWHATQLVQHLDEGGLPVQPFRQGFKSFSPPMKEFERLILERRIAHGGHPLLRYAMQSLAVATDPNENIKPEKTKSTGRIDPVVAFVMALDAWARDTQGESVYEERGMASA